MSVRVCDQLELYMDGELDEAGEDAFRLHLPDCASCQDRLQGVLHVEAMAAVAYAGHAVPAATAATAAPAPVRRARPRWALRSGAMLSALAVASIAAVVVLRVGTAPAESGWMAAEATRGLEARLSYAPADRHRPYVPMRGGEETAHPPPLPAVAALEERGDLEGVAAAYLLGGDPRLADTFLQRLPPSPQREIDRAAVALAMGEPERALQLASSALEALPRSPQGLWNRALALRDLGRAQEAADAFRQIAALGEPGWSDEAAQRADALSPRK
ncbi:MAG TPA: zf-HC2 domain-containing protein [Myxococcales bacterium]|nr:zf-HC2 domain-containing protein [Myxococcales bacterium]